MRIEEVLDCFGWSERANRQSTNQTVRSAACNRQSAMQASGSPYPDGPIAGADAEHAAAVAQASLQGAAFAFAVALRILTLEIQIGTD
jgi:hypothetical protein